MMQNPSNLLRNLLYPLIKSRPHFLIIGSQKAGTTALYRYLVQHPKIVNNKSWKEIHFFDRTENYNQGMGQYLRKFPSRFAIKDKYTLDASPGYLYFPKAAERLKNSLGSIKMIVLLREPSSRAYSAWNMYRAFKLKDSLKHRLESRSFQEAVKEELDGVQPEFADGYAPDYVGRGRYVEQLRNFYRFFPKSNFLILQSSQLKKELQQSLDLVCDFVGIDYFSPQTVELFKQQKHHVSQYTVTEEEQKTLLLLKEYYRPFNEGLYDLLGVSYDW